jgi:hypothetical protein
MSFNASAAAEYRNSGKLGFEGILPCVPINILIFPRYSGIIILGLIILGSGISGACPGKVSRTWSFYNLPRARNLPYPGLPVVS